MLCLELGLGLEDVSRKPAPDVQNLEALTADAWLGIPAASIACEEWSTSVPIRSELDTLLKIPDEETLADIAGLRKKSDGSEVKVSLRNRDSCFAPTAKP